MSTVEGSWAANGERYQPKAALGSQPLSEHAGRESKDSRRLFQLQRAESPANERCQPRLGARSQRLSGRDGPGSSAGRKRPDVNDLVRFLNHAQPRSGALPTLRAKTSAIDDQEIPRCAQLVYLRVLRLGFLQDGDVGVGIFPAGAALLTVADPSYAKGR